MPIPQHTQCQWLLTNQHQFQEERKITPMLAVIVTEKMTPEKSLKARWQKTMSATGKNGRQFISSFLFLMYLFLATLGLCCCAWAFSSCGEWGLLFVVVRGLLIAVACLVAQHGL